MFKTRHSDLKQALKTLLQHYNFPNFPGGDPPGPLNERGRPPFILSPLEAYAAYIMPCHSMPPVFEYSGSGPVNFQCRGVLLIWMIVWQEPTVLTVGVDGGIVWTEILSQRTGKPKTINQPTFTTNFNA